MKDIAKVFICDHSGQVIFYKNLARIIRNYDKQAVIIFLKVNSLSFTGIDFSYYEKEFDLIVNLNFINYRKNFFAGTWDTLHFQNKIKKIIDNLLCKYKAVDLFMDKSAWLPINILLYILSKSPNVRNITKFSKSTLESSKTKTNIALAFLCTLYALFFKCYKVKGINSPKGQFLDYVYIHNTPGLTVQIVSPITYNSINSQITNGIEAPFPIKTNYSSGINKDMVIIFGDESIYRHCYEYLPEYEVYVEKLTNLFRNIEERYSNHRLCYKCHPDSKGKIMPGINLAKYKLLDETINSEMLFDMYGHRIKTVYSFTSTSSINASFFGIPSYTFYRYLCIPAGIKNFDRIWDENKYGSKLLFHLSALDEVGKIDDVKCEELKNYDELWRKILNV